MAEVKINSMALGLVEASWLRNIVGEITGQPDLVLVNDNQACLTNLYDSLYKPENRHLGTKFHLIGD